MRVEIYTDGACRGNPGPGGWGALLRFNGHEKKLKGAEGHTTNNRMELTAAIQALAALTKPSQVDLYTDSKYVQQGMISWIHGWKKKNWKDVKNIDLWQELDKVANLHQVSWHWVRGHSGHPENELADALANQAIDEMNGVI